MTPERGRTHHLVRTYQLPRGLRTALIVLAGLLLFVVITQLLILIGV